MCITSVPVQNQFFKKKMGEITIIYLVETTEYQNKYAHMVYW